MPRTLLISIFCPDRIGLVAAITARLYELGADLGDTAFAVLGGGAEFTTMCVMPEEDDAGEVERALTELPVLAGAEIRVRPFGFAERQAETARITHVIEIEGRDRPGILARLTEVFLQFEANIVRLNSDRVPGDNAETYRIRIAAWIPASRGDACLAALANTASELRLAASWSAV